MANNALESMYSETNGAPDIQLRPWYDIFLPCKEIMEAAQARWAAVRSVCEVLPETVLTSINTAEGRPGNDSF